MTTSRIDLKAGSSPDENLLQQQGGICSMGDSSQSIPNSPEGKLNLPKQLDFPLEHFGATQTFLPDPQLISQSGWEDEHFHIKNKFVPGDPAWLEQFKIGQGTQQEAEM